MPNKTSDTDQAPTGNPINGDRPFRVIVQPDQSVSRIDDCRQFMGFSRRITEELMSLAYFCKIYDQQFFQSLDRDLSQLIQWYREKMRDGSGYVQ